MKRLLQEFVNLILVENKIDDLRKKYAENAGAQTLIDQFAERINNPHYIEWAIKQYFKGANRNDVLPTLQYFVRNKQRFQEKDINKYTAKSLEDAVKELSAKNAGKSKKQVKADIKATGVKKIYEDDFLTLLYIKNKDASICYGAGTRWCITMKDAEYWEEYTQENVAFYFLIDKRLPAADPMSKIAFAIYRNKQNKVTGEEVFDAEDNPINPNDDSGLRSKFSFLQTAKRDAPNEPMNITYALRNKVYGFDDLFEMAFDPELDEDNKVQVIQRLFDTCKEWVDSSLQTQNMLFKLIDLLNNDFGYIQSKQIDYQIMRVFQILIEDSDVAEKTKLKIVQRSDNINVLDCLANENVLESFHDKKIRDQALQIAAAKIEPKYLSQLVPKSPIQNPVLGAALVKRLPELISFYEKMNGDIAAEEFHSDFYEIFSHGDPETMAAFDHAFEQLKSNA